MPCLEASAVERWDDREDVAVIEFGTADMCREVCVVLLRPAHCELPAGHESDHKTSWWNDGEGVVGEVVWRDKRMLPTIEATLRKES